ncbi:MAG: hypothetical protein GY861_01150 [bacterium]|nr:hypothetical protein [bacterium]
MNYSKAKELFESKRKNAESKPLANNTRLFYFPENDCYAIRLHKTDIVKIYSNDSYELNTGNWYTVTTKARMNAYIPINIYTHKRTWFIGNYNHKTDLKYFDGMILDSTGKLLNPEKAPADNSRQKKVLDKSIKKYIDGFCNDIEKNGIEYPNSGDCWLCSLFKDTNDIEHIFSHFNENYYVPSLLFNAIKLAGYAKPEFIFEMIKRNKESHFAKTALKAYFRKNYHTLLDSML